MGCQPAGRDHTGIWFLSPYRSERQPSFHVNPQKNLWYDFGTGEGGDLFTLAARMSGAETFINQARYISEKMAVTPVYMPQKMEHLPDEPTFENVKVSPLTAPALLKYLADRGISRTVAQQYCMQVDYDVRDKHLYAIGFKNRKGGVELRNPFFKGSISPKDVTLISHGNPRCNVFEGFIDFLSAEALGWNDGNDSVILNSVANIVKALPILADYHVILCYLDNDAAGQAALARLQKEFGGKVADKSTLYPNHKDVNDYLQSLAPKQKLKPKL